MNTTVQPITVMILDREYQVACEPEERQALLEAAHYLDEQMRKIRVNGRLMALERIAVMAALNMSHEILNGKELVGEHADLNDRIDSLSERIDNTMREIKLI
jgi:cell division protein ZapA